MLDAEDRHADGHFRPSSALATRWFGPFSGGLTENGTKPPEMAGRIADMQLAKGTNQRRKEEEEGGGGNNT